MMLWAIRIKWKNGEDRSFIMFGESSFLSVAQQGLHMGLKISLGTVIQQLN